MPYTPIACRWRGAGHTLPASVPGSLHDDLLRQGILKDPRHLHAARENEWAALRGWTLEARIPLPGEADRVILCARGVCGRGVLTVGGEAVAPFEPGDFEQDITRLTVSLTEVMVGLRFFPALPAGEPPRVRAAVAGGLSVRGVGEARVLSWTVAPRVVDGYGVVESTVRVCPYTPGPYTFRYAAVLGEETLCVEKRAERLRAYETTLSHRFVVPFVRRFAPGEINEPVLLRLTVERAGRSCDDRFLETGFFGGDAPSLLPGMDLTLEESDALSGPEIARRLSLLRAAGLRCVRARGVQADGLYDALDRNGVLLWQILPDREGEAARARARVLHRPSLIALEGAARPAGSMQEGPARAASATARFAKAEAAEEPGVNAPHSHGAAETAPSSPPPALSPEAFYARVNEDTAPLREIAVLPVFPDLAPEGRPVDGEADPWTGAALDPQEGVYDGSAKLFPATWPESSPSAHPPRAGGPSLALLRRWFGADLSDAGQAARLSRLLQAELVRYAVEQARLFSRAFFLPDLFERFAGGAPCALYGADGPRPAYYALQSAMRPVHACARFDAPGGPCGAPFQSRIFLLSDSPSIGLCTVRASLLGQDGHPLAKAAFEAQPAAAELGILEATLPETPCALVLRLTVERFGDLLDVNDYLLAASPRAPLWPVRAAQSARLRVQNGEAENEGSTAALGVACGAWAHPAYPGYGSLLPGEKRAVRQENGVEGWNV